MFIYSAAYSTKDHLGGWGEAGVRISGESEGMPKWADLFTTVYERYPRFDPLSKGIAILMEKTLGAPPVAGTLGVVLATGTGCRAADEAYYRSAAGAPELASPKLFPYTLPSSGLAEAMIRYQITGPSLVLWRTENPGCMVRQIRRWIETQEINSGLLVWCDAGHGQAWEGAALHVGMRETSRVLPDLDHATFKDIQAAIQAGRMDQANS